MDLVSDSQRCHECNKEKWISDTPHCHVSNNEVSLNDFDIDHQTGDVSRSNIAECSSTRSQKEQEHTSRKEGDALREQTEITAAIMALNGLNIDHQTGDVSRSNIAECSSTRSQNEQEHISCKEGDALREQTEITAAITISNAENELCELCNDLAEAEIGYCFHQYCSSCISVLLNSLSSDEKNFRCVAKNCETLICKRRIEQFSKTHNVKQKESESKIHRASTYSKRQNETETQDGDNAGAIAKLQQKTSSHSAGTKKKKKLKKDHDVRDKVEKTRTSYRRNNTRGMKAESLGLRNVGLSCYRNCILQVLAETPYFCDLLGSFLNSSLKEKQTTWIRYLHTVLVGIETKSTEDHIEELYQFHHEFNISNPGFREYVQEDCLSFLTTLLNGIQEVLQEKRGTSINPTCLFRGKWKDIYTCLKCSTEEYYNESQFYCLPLPYKEKKNKKATIGSCLLGLLEVEYLDFFTCTKCGDALMKKELAIEIFPTILVLQFSKPSEGDESNQDRYLGKKDKFVQFWDHFNGLTNTELKKKIGKNTLTPYRLFGVVEHWGSESSGHYISFVKRKDKRNWQRCDDSYVCDIGLDSVLESNAYLLFYERCETQIE